MATISAARSASERSKVAHYAEAQGESRLDLSTRTEIDVVARALCAVSMHTRLTDALMSFYAALEPTEARERTTLVLDRMRKILPHDLSGDLSEACGYERPWAEEFDDGIPAKRSRVERFALPALYLIGITMLALSVVGSITMIHYLLRR